jgi:hypothetical protein
MAGDKKLSGSWDLVAGTAIESTTVVACLDVSSSVAEERSKPSCYSPAPTDGISPPRRQRPAMEDGTAAWLLGGDGGGFLHRRGQASDRQA